MGRNARGNMTKPPLSEVCKWVANAWGKITNETVRNALKAGYIEIDIDFMNAHIGSHEKFGPLIASRQGDSIESSNDSEMDENDALLIDE